MEQGQIQWKGWILSDKVLEVRDMDYVTHKECEEYRNDIENKIMEQSLKFVELESNLKHMQTTLNMILGSLLSGIGSIIVILLTRGIK